MSKAQMKGRIDALAATLQDWLRDSGRMGMNAPLPEEIAKVITDHMQKFGTALVSDEEWIGEEKQLPALLKPPIVSTEAKRMRELAGIPHKKNFV